MHKIAEKPELTRSGYVETGGGLLVPPGYRQSTAGELATRSATMARRSFSASCSDGFAYGLRVERDPDTLVIRWAEKGSGLDDLISEALADGTIGNVGIAPVVFAQLSGLIRRRQNMMLSVSAVVSGDPYPVARVRNAIARWNDSPLGAIDAMRRLAYQLDTYNRGAPIATVPLWLPAEQWESEGLLLHRFPESNHYWLEVDWLRRQTPIPCLPSVFDLEPTDSGEWPYWLRKRIDGAERWVLLHRTQILPVLTGHSGRRGIGTSSVYMCLGFLGEHALVIDERYEAMIDGPGEGIVTLSGVTQSAEQIRAKLEADIEANSRHDWTLLASPNEVKVGAHRWRQPDGVAWEKRQQHFEDVLALAFDEPLSSVVVRGGVGYGAQADVVANGTSEGGIFAVMKLIELALGSIYPRVTVTVTKPNDRARRLNLELLDKFATAVGKLPEGTLSGEEIRAYIDRELITIPAAEAARDARAGTDGDDDGAGETDDNSDAARDLAEESAALLREIRGEDDRADCAISHRRPARVEQERARRPGQFTPVWTGGDASHR